MELSEMLEHLRELKRRYQRSSQVTKKREAAYKEYDREVHSYLTRNNLDATATGGHTFAPRSTVSGNVYDLALFEEWLEQQGLLDDYVKSEPQKARLNELVRERLDNQAELPPGVNAYVKEYVSITER